MFPPPHYIDGKVVKTGAQDRIAVRKATGGLFRSTAEVMDNLAVLYHSLARDPTIRAGE